MPVVIVSIDDVCQFIMWTAIGWVVQKILFEAISQIVSQRPKKFERGPSSPFR